MSTTPLLLNKRSIKKEAKVVNKEVENKNLKFKRTKRFFETQPETCDEKLLLICNSDFNKASAPLKTFKKENLSELSTLDDTFLNVPKNTIGIYHPAANEDFRLLKVKSKYYRCFFPEKWHQRLIEKKIKYEKSRRVYRVNQMIEHIYSNRKQIKKETKEKKESVYQAIEFNIDLTMRTSRKSQKDTSLNLNKKRFSMVPRTSYDFEDYTICDLSVKLNSVFNISKLPSSSDILNEARVCCYLYPDWINAECKKLTTPYTPIKNNSCNFQHEFLFRGVPRRSCNQKYVLLELKAKTSYERAVLGTTLLSGSLAKIYTNSGFTRKPKKEETEVWMKAIGKVNQTVSACNKLINANDDFEHLFQTNSSYVQSEDQRKVFEK